MASKRTPAAAMALGGILAAAAVVIMNLVGMIPVNTYVVPVLCMVLLQLVLKNCGKRVAWAWYAAVSILGLLMCPDKEAAAIFAVIGYYPILKPWLDRRKLKWFWKALLFNGVILLLYWSLMNLMGMTELAAEFSELGIWMTAVTLLLGNVTFFMLDKVLGKDKLKVK